jgi:phosphate transport system substrate-binding protein
MKLRKLIAVILIGCLLAVSGAVPAFAGASDLIIEGAPQVNDVIEPGMNVFRELYPAYSVDITVLGDGATNKVLPDLKAGTIDIGMIGRALASSDDPDNILSDLLVARESLVMIANTQSGLSKINYAQIKAIYEGTVTDWSDLGGESLKPRSYDTASGLHKTFTSTNWFAHVDSTLEETVIEATGLERLADSAEMAKAIAENPGQIGYIGIGYLPFLDASVKCLDLSTGFSGSSYISPDLKNVYKHAYPSYREFHLIYRKDNSKQALKDYLDFVASSIGQNEIALAGGVKRYADADVNHDGEVNIADIMQVGTEWDGSDDPGWIFEDVNRDGSINILDVVMIGFWWGYKYTAA